LKRLSLLVLAACLLLLFAPAVRADDLDEANELIGRTNKLEMSTIGLDEQGGELLDEAYAIEPGSAKSRRAALLLDQTADLVALVLTNDRSTATIWRQIMALDVPAATKTYAAKELKVSEAHAEAYTAIHELVTTSAKVYREYDRLSPAELDRLGARIDELSLRSDELQVRYDRLAADASAYYEDNDLDEDASGGRSPLQWIISLSVAGAFSLASGLVARNKNRNVVGWAALGFFLPLIGLGGALAVRKAGLGPATVPPASGPPPALGGPPPTPPGPPPAPPTPSAGEGAGSQA
jgi:hypothetical protein